MDSPVEWVQDGDQPIALIIRAEAHASQTTFLTPDHFTQQAGFVVYPEGGKVAAHVHKPLHREITGTPETLIVRKGKMESRFYDDQKELIAIRILNAGDVIMLISGGHGFTMLEETILLEIKQGPYTGLIEKERFE